MEAGRSGKLRSGTPPRGAPLESKRATGSGTGSSDNESLASEVGRLSEENAQLSRKLSEILGKTPASPPSTRGGTASLSSSSGERLRDQLKKLERDNRRLAEQNATLERRLSGTKVSATADEVWRLKEENRGLRTENAQLSSEIEQLNKVASYVGNRVAKVLVGARRANNYNSQLVGELKRWNRRLEDENHRLYNIIDRLQKKSGGSDAAAREALSSFHDRGMDGNAKLVKQLEDQNVKLQEEISKLSDHAISLQNLSSSSGSSGSSGILPRTPSNHEQEGPGMRHQAVAERLRDVKAERRKSRNLSGDSLASEPGVGGEDMERLRQENKKYAEELERIGTDLAYVRSQVTLSKELQDSNAAQSQQIQKLTEAAARVEALESKNASQADEIQRLLAAQAKLEADAKAAAELREDNSQMEEDIFKLADEVERLQPLADKGRELEAQIAELQQELAEARSKQSDTAVGEIGRLKEDKVEIQRTLEALAAEKAGLQAQVRALLEERAQLQSQNKDLDLRVRQLAEKAGLAAGLQAELKSLSSVRGQSATYRAQISSLRNENEALAAKVSDLGTRLLELQAVGASGAAAAAAAAASQVSQQAQELASAQERLEVVRKELEALRAENSSLAAELEEAKAECSYLAAQLEATGAASQGRNADAEAELEQLRAKNRELSESASQAVLLTVELTTLRNQLRDREELEAKYAEALQQQKGLQAEVAALTARVAAAEKAQHAAEAALAAGASVTSAEQQRLAAQQKHQQQEIAGLQEQQRSLAAQLAEREALVAALRQEQESLCQEHDRAGLRSAASLNAATSESKALQISLQQERAALAAAGAEAERLRALLATARSECAAQESALAGLRSQNQELQARLVGVSHQQTKSMKSSFTSENHSSSAVLVANPAFQATTPETPLPVHNAQFSSEETAGPVGSPIQAAKANGVAAKSSVAKNGKTGSGGFSKFFRLSGKRSGSLDAPTPEAEEAPVTTTLLLSPPPPFHANSPPSADLMACVEEQVLGTYERHVDSDDIDGFMASLGFPGFKGPTDQEDMQGAFASAKYACRPGVLPAATEWDRAVARATQDLLEAWHAAWAAADAEE